MNKKFLLPLLLIGSALIFSACIKKNVQSEQDENQEAQVQQQEQNQQAENSLGENFKGSLKNLLGMGKQVKCTWKIQEESMTIEGIVYIDNKKSKMEMKMTDARVDKNSPMANLQTYTYADEEWVYNWGGPNNQGMKFKLEDMKKMQQEAEETSGDNETDGESSNIAMKNWQEEYEYHCQPWKVDQSVFQLPGDVKFVDLNETIKEAQEQSNEMMKNMKGMCDSLPEPQKSECLQNF